MCLELQHRPQRKEIWHDGKDVGFEVRDLAFDAVFAMYITTLLMTSGVSGQHMMCPEPILAFGRRPIRGSYCDKMVPFLPFQLPNLAVLVLFSQKCCVA